MKELSPPIFIFHQEIFFKHLQKFKLNELEEILNALNKLESMSKKTRSPSLALSENFIQNLCLN
jgi:DNA polymerase III delta subunit